MNINKNIVKSIAVATITAATACAATVGTVYALKRYRVCENIEIIEEITSEDEK